MVLMPRRLALVSCLIKTRRRSSVKEWLTGDTRMADRITVAITDGVADVRLRRPGKMNALHIAMFEALVDTTGRLSREKGLRGVVLSGQGRAFCAGLDMGRFAAMKESGGAGLPGGADRVLAARTHGEANFPQQSVWGWRQLPVPVI